MKIKVSDALQEPELPWWEQPVEEETQQVLKITLKVKKN